MMLPQLLHKVVVIFEAHVRIDYFLCDRSKCANARSAFHIGMTEIHINRDHDIINELRPKALAKLT